MIGVISAMPEELSAVVEAMHADQVTELGGRKYYKGRYAGEDVVCVVSRIGKVAAATTATILLERFSPRALVMTGLAGGVDERLGIGDIVIADRLIQHDLDARPLFPQFEVPLLGVTEFPADSLLSGKLAAAAEKLVGPSRVWRGLIASGDQFFASVEATTALRARVPGALAVEMEGAAVAQVCYEHGVRFGIARVISDTANHGAAVDFSKFLCEACGPYARALVEGALAP
jgi:adenosylhomocysteine nucleosidase